MCKNNNNSSKLNMFTKIRNSIKYKKVFFAKRKFYKKLRKSKLLQITK